MFTYPPMGQLMAHAKFISRALNIKLSYAKETVAYMYGFGSFEELSNHSGHFNIEGQETDIVLPCYADVGMLKLLLQTHLPAICAHRKPNIHIHGSLIDKVVNNKIHCISGNVITSLLDREYPIDWTDSRSVIDRLELVDDTASSVLTSRFNPSVRKDNINLWIKNASFGIQIYGYYNFSRSSVSIKIQELNFMFEYPNEHRRMWSRKWTGDYIVGFLGWLAKQFQSVGYTGSIELHNVSFPFGLADKTCVNFVKSPLPYECEFNDERKFDGFKVPIDELANMEHPSIAWLGKNLLN